MKPSHFVSISVTLMLLLMRIGGAGNAGSQSSDELAGSWKGTCTAIRGGNSGEGPGEWMVEFTRESDGRYYSLSFPPLCKYQKAGPSLYSCEYFTDLDYGGRETDKNVIEIHNGRLTLRSLTTYNNSTYVVEQLCTATRVQSDSNSSGFGDCSPTLNSNDTPNSRSWSSVRPFSEGLAAVGVVPRDKRSGQWGFVDRTGKLVIPIKYDVVTSFYGGLAGVGVLTNNPSAGGIYFEGDRSAKWGVIDITGKLVTTGTPYRAAKILGAGFAAVGYEVPGQLSGRWNLINRAGTVIAKGFEDIGCFSGGRARATYKDSIGIHTGYIDRTGKFYEDPRRTYD
jgi:WG containing repeat